MSTDVVTIFGIPLLTAVTWLPALGALVLLLLPKSLGKKLHYLAFAVSAATALISVPVYTHFPLGTAHFQYVEDLAWIPTVGAHYLVGVDGISLFLVLLTTFLTPLALLASWSAIEHRVKEYVIAILVLETAMLGVFVSLDLLLFYFFWEAMLIPMYLLIGVWGGPRRLYATMKFVLYTMFGSVLMLVAILVLVMQYYQHTGQMTFGLQELMNTPLSPGAQILMFSAFALAFAIKVPMFPFHTWLPDAHVEAPTAGSVILAGVLLKMGLYGFLRFCLPLFPVVAVKAAPVMATLAIIGIIYGALVSLMQKDVKKLVAYSSVSHLGFCVLGIFALNMQGVTGSLVQSVNHGLSTGALFLLIGMIYERRHTRQIADFGGLAHVLPVFATFFMITMLSSVGVPGLNGFVGEFLILLGAFRANWVWGTLAATGVILGAVYMLRMYQRVFYGPVTHDANKVLRDLNLREILILVPVFVGMVWIGLFSPAMTKRMEPSIEGLLAYVRSEQAHDVTSSSPQQSATPAVSPPGASAEGIEPVIREPANPPATEASAAPSTPAAHEAGH